MELSTEKNFTIIDSPEMCTLAFAVNKPEAGTSYCTLQKLNYTLPDSTNAGKKTFYLENNDSAQDDIVLLTIDGEKAFLNTAILTGDKLLVSEKPSKVSKRCIFRSGKAVLIRQEKSPWKTPSSATSPGIFC